jgi:hypothetical protein
VKKIFPELLITNIAQFLCEYCTTTSIWTTNCELFDFFISHFTNTWGGGTISHFISEWGGTAPPGPPSATGLTWECIFRQNKLV